MEQDSKKPVTRYSLLVPKDNNKDQTYFLHQLNQAQLSKVLFPLGEYTKDEVRQLAKKFELPTAEKEESMGICFVGEVPMDEFLKTRIKPTPGEIVLGDGTVVGEHQGLAFYTIGQRHFGLQSTDYRLQTIKKTVDRSQSSLDLPQNSKPLYVVDKNFDKHQLIVGHEDDPLLYKKETTVEDVSWISGKIPDFGVKYKVRLRHRQKMQSAKLKMKNDDLVVEFDERQRAVTPGQFAVFYLASECLGGGVIQ